MASSGTGCLVQRVAESRGFGIPTEEVRKLGGFLDVLGAWGRKMNLTGDPSPESVAREHLPDGLEAAALIIATLGEAPEGEAVDVGSGGGLPGVFLAVLISSLRWTFVEPRGRRAAFLRMASHRLELGARVLTGGIDAVKGGAFRVATSRATWPAEAWVGRGERLVASGGMVVAFGSGEVPARLLDGEVRYYEVGGRGRWVSAVGR